MDRLRLVLARVRTYLGQMTATQRLLVGSLCVIAVMALFLVSQYAGRPQMVPLMPGMPADEQERAMSALATLDIDARMRNGEVVVTRASYHRAFAALAQRGELPREKTQLFRNLLEFQDWKLGREENRQQAIFALQNELAAFISKMDGVREARVVIDDPPPAGLGRAAREPTAVVTVWTRDGGPMPQHLVDAAANMVTGSRAGLTVERVQVIDASAGHRRRARGPDEVLPSTRLEAAQRFEAETREKLEALLAHIPGAYVAVSVQVDVARREIEELLHKPLGEGTVSLPGQASARESLTVGQSRAAEPGAGSNQTADINYAPSGTGTRVETSDTDDRYENAIGREVRRTTDPGGTATLMVASVNIPEGYVRELVRRELEASGQDAGAGDAGGGGAGGAGVAREAVLARFAELRPQIERSLAPHLKGRTSSGDTVDGQVVVEMVPGDFTVVHAVGAAGGAKTFGGAAGVLGIGGEALDTLVLSALALTALTMMLVMVRKGGRQLKLPTAEELVGIPPTLETNEELVGEADETEAAIPGFEVDEAHLRASKTLEQVINMVKQDPDAATRLIGRWIRMEDD